MSINLNILYPDVRSICLSYLGKVKFFDDDLVEGKNIHKVVKLICLSYLDRTIYEFDYRDIEFFRKNINNIDWVKFIRFNYIISYDFRKAFEKEIENANKKINEISDQYQYMEDVNWINLPYM